MGRGRRVLLRYRRSGYGRAVSAAGLWLAQLSNGRASAGYSVAPGERGHGYAADALTALTDFAWTLPRPHRVELHIEPWNIGSIRTAQRSGHAREGLMRGHQEIGDRRRDMLLNAAIRADYDAESHTESNERR